MNNVGVKIVNPKDRKKLTPGCMRALKNLKELGRLVKYKPLKREASQYRSLHVHKLACGSFENGYVLTTAGERYDLNRPPAIKKADRPRYDITTHFDEDHRLAYNILLFLLQFPLSRSYAREIARWLSLSGGEYSDYPLNIEYDVKKELNDMVKAGLAKKEQVMVSDYHGISLSGGKSYVRLKCNNFRITDAGKEVLTMVQCR